MPSNLIVSRVSEFLATHAPFDLLDEQERLKLSEQVEIIYFDDHKVIFSEGDQPGENFYVVRKGRVNLFRKINGDDNLMDVCGEGDMFGIRSMLSNEAYKLTARVENEALVYAIPVAIMRSVISENAGISRFFAVGLASGRVIMNQPENLDEKAAQERFHMTGYFGGLHQFVMEREIVRCSLEDQISNVAGEMAGKHSDCAIITDQHDHPVGILTDTDLRKEVATGKTGIGLPVSTIMSSPVITIRADQHAGDAILTMMKEEVHHLCITEDGTPGSALLGVISNHDLLISQGSSPTMLMRALGRASSLEELRIINDGSDRIIRQMIAADVPVDYILEVASALRDMLVKRAFELIKGGHPELNDGRYCFVDLGSSARKEQVVKTDLDNLMIFEPEPSVIGDQLPRLAETLNHFLAGCGYAFCPAGTMAHKPSMIRPLSGWVEKIDGWIFQPDPEALLNTTIFFDLRAIYGDQDLVAELKKYIIGSIRKQPSFLNYLAFNAVKNPPPLSFFNQFIVETSGEHKNEFDIKKRAVMPLVDAARLFALENQYYDSVSTVERFRNAVHQEPKNKGLFEESIHAFFYLLKMRARNGLMHGDDGRYIDIKACDNIDKKILKEIFQVIRELHKLINVRFQLDYFR